MEEFVYQCRPRKINKESLVLNINKRELKMQGFLDKIQSGSLVEVRIRPIGGNKDEKRTEIQTD
jgi:hypothetical protein